jgi:predicted DNA-binding transcriptional regulator AlpA
MPARRHAFSDTHWSTREVGAVTGLPRQTIAAMVENGTFPPPITTNPRPGRTAIKLYLKVEVQEWLAMHHPLRGAR